MIDTKDARIAELEAERDEARREANTSADNCNTAEMSANNLHAELASLRARRCETCAFWDNIFCDNPESLAAGKLSPSDIGFFCNCWTEK